MAGSMRAPGLARKSGVSKEKRGGVWGRYSGKLDDGVTGDVSSPARRIGPDQLAVGAPGRSRLQFVRIQVQRLAGTFLP